MPPDEAAVPQLPPAPKDGFFYGGQAVIEGVMMRGRRHYAVAVRVPRSDEIRVDRGAYRAAFAARLRNRSTWPPVSTIRCVPV